jgi:hypothetical protein
MSAATEGKKRLARGFTVNDAMIAEFKAFLLDEKVKIDEEAFAKDLDFIKAMIHYDIDDALFGITERQKNLDRERPAGAVRAGPVRRSRQADRTDPQPDRGQGRSVIGI